MILALEVAFGRRKSTEAKTMTNVRRNKFDVIFFFFFNHAIVKFLFLVICKHGYHIYSAIDAIH